MEAVVRRALSWCCIVGDNSESQQLWYVGDPQLQENVNGFSPVVIHGDAGRVQRPEAAGPEGTAWDSTSMPEHHPVVSRDEELSPEERQREKERLQDLVKEFAKAVVQGQPCEWLPSALGAPQAAVYSFDKALRNFSIRPHDAPALSLDLSSIREVLKDVRGTPFSELQRLPPPHALAGAELQRRFVCLQHQSDDANSTDAFLGLLMPNAYERERFYTCMKILRWAVDSRQRSS